MGYGRQKKTGQGHSERGINTRVGQSTTTDTDNASSVR